MFTGPVVAAQGLWATTSALSGRVVFDNRHDEDLFPMKIATYNVNSIRQRLPIVLDWITEHRPDVMCLQETKVQDHDFPIEAFQKADTTRPFGA